jgi:magnesium-transporting ATPase (P-type)
LRDERRQEILRTNDALAAQALRTLDVAFRSVPAGTLADDDWMSVSNVTSPLPA